MSDKQVLKTNPTLKRSEEYNRIIKSFTDYYDVSNSTVRAIELAEEVAMERLPLFTDEHLRYFQALLAVNSTEAPLAQGYTQEDIMEYASNVGRFNGILDILSYLCDKIDTGQVQPQQDQPS